MNAYNQFTGAEAANELVTMGLAGVKGLSNQVAMTNDVTVTPDFTPTLG